MKRVLLGAMTVLAIAAMACLGGDDQATTSPTLPPTATPAETPFTLTPRPEPATRTPTTTPDGTPETTPTPDETSEATPTPQVVPTLDQGGLPMKVLNYAHPVVPGQLAFVTLISEQGAECSATLEYSKQDAGPARLQRKEISPVGQVDWAWKVLDSPEQAILVTTTCRRAGRQGVRQFTIEVEKAPQ